MLFICSQVKRNFLIKAAKFFLSIRAHDYGKIILGAQSQDYL